MNLDGKLGLCVMGLRHSLEHSNPRTLTFRAERQSVRMSKITIDGLAGSGTGCFIASCASTHNYDNSGRLRDVSCGSADCCLELVPRGCLRRRSCS